MKVTKLKRKAASWYLSCGWFAILDDGTSFRKYVFYRKLEQAIKRVKK